MKKNLTLLFLFFAGIVAAQVTIFPNGSAWKYLDNGTDQGMAWYGTGFNDASWAGGNGELGYGDGDEATVVSFGSNANAKYVTTYFRKTFTVASVASYTAYTINLKRDDGVIIYINGSEVYRNNMPASGVNYTTYASTNCADDGGTIWSATLPASVIVTGTNVIAAEIHQTNATSSDLTFELNLVGNTNFVVPTIVKGPYLQIGTQNSMIVRWETNIATDSKVMYGTSASTLSSVATNTVSSVTHSVQLSGLNAYTKYFYNIGTSTLITQGDTNNYFLTSPVPGTPGKYRFWMVGDCGNASTNQTNCKNQYKLYNGNKITNGMLLSGDNAYSSGTQAEFNNSFFNIYQGDVLKNMPLWPAPGNHDYNNGASTATTVPYFSIFSTPANGEAGGVASNNPAYYSYDYGNIHFLSLDSYGRVGSEKMYDTTGAQVNWIKADLAANNKKWVIAYWHHPPYTMGSHNSDSEGDLVNIRSKFIRILERYGVDMIITGHSHDYERSKLMNGHYGNEASFSSSTHNKSLSTAKYDGSSNSCPYQKDSVLNKVGTVYVLSGSAGQLGGQQTSFPHDAMYYSNATNGGTFIMDIEDNKLDAKWLCADGQIRDQFTIYKDVSAVKSFTVLPTQTVNLQASWPGSYTWNDASTTKTLSAGSAANATFWVKDPYSCVTDTFKLKVLPAVSFTMATPYCASSAITFSDLSTNNTTAWNWSVTPSAGVSMSSSTAKNPSITFNNAGTYTVSLIADNAYGSGIVQSKTIIVNANPNVLATLSATAICLNQTATLTASGASSYLWNTSATATVLTVSPLTNTTYTLTGTDLNGCQTTSIKTLVVNALPSVSVVSNPTNAIICVGDNITLSGSGANTYNWTGGITNATGFTLSAGLMYTVTGTDANGCQNIATQSITVNPLPVLGVSSTPTSAAVCAGSTLILNASGATTYTWTGTATNGAAFVPSASGMYTVTATDVNGCKSSTTQSVTVNSLPVLAVAGNATVCTGSTTTFTPSGGISYSMVTNTSGSATTLGSFMAAPLANDTYTFMVVDANGCRNSLTKAIVVNPLPTVIISGNMVLCAGETTTITPSGALTYSWSNGSTNANLIIAPAVGYNYMVTGFDANGCKNVATTSFSVNALPVISASSNNSLICAGQSVTLTVSGAAIYMWSTNVAGPSIVVSPATTTSYSVTGTNINNCSTETSLVQQVSGCTGFDPIASKNTNALIFPNPNNGTFNIELNTPGNFKAEVFNALGERVYSAKLEKGNTTISLSEKKGIYFYVILDGTRKVETGKIVVE